MNSPIKAPKLQTHDDRLARIEDLLTKQSARLDKIAALSEAQRANPKAGERQRSLLEAVRATGYLAAVS